MSMECQALRCRHLYFMRRFFLIALAAVLLSPTAAKAEPVPGISDPNLANSPK